MKCLKCDCTQFLHGIVIVKPKIRGEKVVVKATCAICAQCKAPRMNMDQLSELLRKAVDAYRRSQRLLTSDAISRYRERLGMTPLAFANFLNIEEKSIKRWETFHIQDVGHDRYMRVKCDLEIARLNYLQLYSHSRKADIYSGKRKFSLEVFKQVVLFFSELGNVCKNVLNKLLFYVDFLHYKKHQVGITGTNYVSRRLGPSPDYYLDILQTLIFQGCIKSKGKDRISYSDHVTFDERFFDSHEKTTMEEVKYHYTNKESRHIHDLSLHKNKFLRTHEHAFISYKHARDLLI